MKRTILAASVLSVFFLYQPVLAVEAHHPAKSEAAPAEMQQDMTQMDTSLQNMQEMREKIEMEKTPAARQELMQQHMQMMRESTQMMSKMGGMEMMGGGDMSKHEGHTAMKNPKDQPKDQKGGMMGHEGGMMGGMMGGPSTKAMDDRMGMMEKKMMLMQEIMNGMMTQQEMKAK